MNLHLIRHGESEGNIDNSKYFEVNDYDIELSALGYNQVSNIYPNINSESVKVYCSPYKRCIQTLKGMQFNLPPITEVYDYRLREQFFGVHNSKEDVEVEFLKHMNDRWYYKNTTSENGFDVFDRIHSFLDRIVHDKEEDIIIVTHGIICNVIECIINNYPMDKYTEMKFMKNATVKTIFY